MLTVLVSSIFVFSTIPANAGFLGDFFTFVKKLYNLYNVTTVYTLCRDMEVYDVIPPHNEDKQWVCKGRAIPSSEVASCGECLGPLYGGCESANFADHKCCKEVDCH